VADDRSERFGRIYDARQHGNAAYLRAALRDPDWRGTAAGYLADLDAREAIPELVRLLDVAKPTDRAAAAKALGRFRAGEAVARLTEVATSDPVDPTRSYAISSLGMIGDRRALEPLKQLLNDPEPWIRVSAIAALARFRDADADLAIRLARRSESKWRWRYRYWRALRGVRSRGSATVGGIPERWRSPYA
jgi:HEAT repeat protein